MGRGEIGKKKQDRFNEAAIVLIFKGLLSRASH